MNAKIMAYSVAAGFSVMGVGALVLSMLDPPAPPAERPVTAPVAPVTQDAVVALSPRATRLFYKMNASQAWGSACELDGGGYASVHHVTENGTPTLGPRDKVTASDELSDYAFIGVHPNDLSEADFPAMVSGQKVYIHGFVARDRAGQVVPGVVYTDDPDPDTPYWWIELHDSATDRYGNSIEAEGVIGGFSGSCVLNEAGEVLATVSANGFSKIEGTTSTWAKVVPIGEAVRMAKGGKPTESRVGLFSLPRPNIAAMMIGIGDDGAPIMRGGM